MPSSQTEIEQLVDCYSEAYKALLQGQVDQLSEVFGAAEKLIESIDFESLDAEALQSARSAYGRLMSALTNELDATGDELKKIRRGKKQMKKIRFRPAGDLVGTRIFSEA